MSNVIDLVKYKEELRILEVAEGLTDLMCYIGGYEYGEQNIPEGEYKDLLIEALNAMEFPQDLIDMVLEVYKESQEEENNP